MIALLGTIFDEILLIFASAIATAMFRFCATGLIPFERSYLKPFNCSP